MCDGNPVAASFVCLSPSSKCLPVVGQMAGRGQGERGGRGREGVVSRSREKQLQQPAGSSAVYHRHPK